MRRLAVVFLPLCLLLFAGCVARPCSVYVMNFEVIAKEPEYQYLGKVVSELLTHELANTPEFSVLDPQERSGLQRKDWPLKKIGRVLRADYLIMGSITHLDETFVLEGRLFSVDRGHVVPGTTVKQICRTEEEIPYNVARLAEQLRYQIQARSWQPVAEQESEKQPLP